MGLLDTGTWHGKIYSNGWVDGSGGDYPVIEPATGAELGRIGHATPADVRQAAQAAARAQRSWAAAPYSERAAVLRRVGDLWNSCADEIKTWLSRETGTIPPLGDLQVHVSADECYDAAALASQPYGELLRTPQPEEIFGPVAPVVGFDSIDEAVELAAGTEYGLSLGILTRDVYKGLEIAERIPAGVVHINDQTVADEATIPFGGVGASGNGGRLGGAQANLEAFTETQWVTVRGDLPAYPF